MGTGLTMVLGKYPVVLPQSSSRAEAPRKAWTLQGSQWPWESNEGKGSALSLPHHNAQEAFVKGWASGLHPEE